MEGIETTEAEGVYLRSDGTSNLLFSPSSTPTDYPLQQQQQQQEIAPYLSATVETMNPAFTSMEDGGGSGIGGGGMDGGGDYTDYQYVLFHISQEFTDWYVL